jgi:antitoxin ParD1/3/4
MAIQLPPDIEARIQQKVADGAFPDAAEVIREAMRLLDQQERQLEEFRAKFRSGLDQLDRGEGIPFTPELMAKIRQDVAERYRRGERPHPDVCP